MTKSIYDTHEEYQYIRLLAETLQYGIERPDRTGVGTIGQFGTQMRFDLSGGKIPLLTTKKVHFKGIVHELLWMISGSTNIKYLKDNGITIWDEWADENGELGPVYGKQWRDWEDYECYRNDWCTQNFDQLQKVIDDIKSNPYSRRHIVSSWNVAELNDMALPPCHLMYQFCVYDGKLSCHFLMRSTDICLGLPYNLAFYALLTNLVAQQTGLEPGELVYTGVDVHVYKNHIEGAKIQIGRTPVSFPTVTINKKGSIDEYTIDDFTLHDYKPWSAIKFEVAV